jgi:imidazole glycerol-phosphate synthase subunit HisF
MKARIIPVLGLRSGGLYKTIQFKQPVYVGDPLNAVKVFNEKNVHELMVSGFRASVDNSGPEWKTLRDIANEAFMPLAYGGGIRNMTDVDYLIKMGYEKVCFSTALFNNPELVKESIRNIGSSSVMASLDYVTEPNGKRVCRGMSGQFGGSSYELNNVIKMVQDWGVGEIVLHSIERDGTYKGYDFETLEMINNILQVPLVLLGGASGKDDIKMAINKGVQGIGASSLFVFYGRLRSVLINYFEEGEL